MSLEILGRRGATLADPLNVLCVSVLTIGCACQCVYDGVRIPLHTFVLVAVDTHMKHAIENLRALSCMSISIRWLNW